MAAYRRVYDSRHLQLTAKNRDQLRNPTLCNRVWATFTFFKVKSCKEAYTDIAVRVYIAAPLRGTHMPYGITQCYLPLERGDIHAFTRAKTGTRYSTPGLS